MTTKYKNIISTKEEFEGFRFTIGNPSPLATKKVISFIDEHCVDFISNSPFFKSLE